MMHSLSGRNTKPKRQKTPHPIDMERVATIILGGGEGTDLFPFTLSRCKPAISFGGKARLVDIPMSNAVNSKCQNIFIVSQFLSSSLHQHILRTYRQGSHSTGFIELLSSERKPGAADAIRENMEYFIETPADYFLILSGDQIYNIDFRNMLRLAQTTNADLVVAALPVEEKRAKQMGVLKVDKNIHVTDFFENPTKKKEREPFKVSDSFKEKLGFGKRQHYLGSMGLYLFKRNALFRLLERDRREDFGTHLIPTQIEQGNSVAYIHHGYWANVSTVQSFYDANIALTSPSPKFNWYDEHNPIFTTQTYLPPPKFAKGKIESSIICDGSIVEAKEIKNSILGFRTRVGEKSVIKDSYIMGNDFYTPPIPTQRLPEELRIGKSCRIEKAIIDKHVSIGNDVKLVNKKKLKEFDSENVYIRDGIIIVKRSARIPDGFVL